MRWSAVDYSQVEFKLGCLFDLFFISFQVLHDKIEQECIPVGFIPPARYRMAGAGSLSREGLCLSRGVGLFPGGSLSVQGGSLSREVSVSGVSVRGVSVQRVSVQGVSVQGWSLSRGVSVEGGCLCPGVSLSREVSVWGGLCPTGLCP